MDYQEFVGTHIRQNMTSLIKDMVAVDIKYREQLRYVLTYIDYEGLLEDLDEDCACQQDYGYYYKVGQGKYAVTVAGENFEAADLKEVACILADAFDIKLSNYSVDQNTWLAVSKEFYEYLGENGERVMDWNGIYLWGTYRLHSNQTPNMLDMVSCFYLANK